MKLATFNVENMFDRPKAMNQETWAEGEKILKPYKDLNSLISKDQYTDADKQDMLKCMQDLGIIYENNKNAWRLSSRPKWVILRKTRGKFTTQPRDSSQSVKIVANGRNEWIGWVELRKESVREEAIFNTARVIKDMDPDVLGVIEADNRPSLLKFSEDIIEKRINGNPFEHIMLVEGNDERGIDVGVLTKKGFKINFVRSHVDDKKNGTKIFSRDCPEYEIKTETGKTIWLLINHLKSKGYGGQIDSDNRRKMQAERVREIYDELRQGGAEYVASVGDFNDYPDHGPLDPLLKQGSDLKDVSASDKYKSGGYPGTYGGCGGKDKFDYILLSPELFALIKEAGVYRKGVYAGKRNPKWEMYASMTGQPKNAASDHAMLWVDLDV